MKKVLLASAALLVSGIVSANAAPVKLSVGGYANWYTGYVDGNNFYNDLPYNHVPVLGDVEVHFKGETALQNGVKIGAVIELEGVSGGYLISEGGGILPKALSEDQSYIYVDTSFGRFVMGKMDSISKQLHTASKDVGLLGIQDSDISKFQTTIVGVSTDIRINDNASTIAYISPKFMGFTLAASYSDMGIAVTHNFGGNDAMYMGTLAYDNTFGSVRVAADVSYAKYDARNVSYYDIYPFGPAFFYDDIISAGLRVGVAGFTFGAGYKHENGRYGTDDVNTFDVGLAYENGSYGVSLSYINENPDGFSMSDMIVPFYGSEMYLLSGSYNITEGVDTFASVAYVKNKVDSEKLESYVVATGLGLSF